MFYTPISNYESLIYSSICEHVVLSISRTDNTYWFYFPVFLHLSLIYKIKKESEETSGIQFYK